MIPKLAATEPSATTSSSKQDSGSTVNKLIEGQEPHNTTQEADPASDTTKAKSCSLSRPSFHPFKSKAGQEVLLPKVVTTEVHGPRVGGPYFLVICRTKNSVEV